ncbi:MAG: FtsW/RodA/SpoVE family cell cycle protein, partial [Roseovarius sp.]|nr:FtsW/RodA/SpoVE family cell cycle protein [Roseovarius sp.]
VMAAGVYFYKTSEHLSRLIDGYLRGDHAPNSQLGFAENAIREGGLLGVGPGEGELKWNLPDAHSDFIIAVAAEEYGLFLVILIIFLYLLIMSRSMHRLMRDRDPFIRLAGTGLVTMFSVQAIINIGVAARLLPAKGMTLPMVSYGGSSMLAIGFALGMIIAFTRTKVQGEIRDVLRGNM